MNIYQKLVEDVKELSESLAERALEEFLDVDNMVSQFNRDHFVDYVAKSLYSTFLRSCDPALDGRDPVKMTNRSMLHWIADNLADKDQLEAPYSPVAIIDAMNLPTVEAEVPKLAPVVPINPKDRGH